jgi:hypothetical protein
MQTANSGHFPPLGRITGCMCDMPVNQFWALQRLRRIESRDSQRLSGLAASRFALPITLSIGLTFATPCETVISMLARADMALYNAKRAGRNCIRILPESIDQDSSDNADMLTSRAVGLCHYANHQNISGYA